MEQNEIMRERVWAESGPGSTSPLLAAPVLDRETLYYHIDCRRGRMLRTGYHRLVFVNV